MSEVRGKNVRLYLAADGVRHVEMVGWTGQGFACPRHRIESIKSWKQELGRPGVYILVGSDPTDQSPMAYIGETDNVILRMRDHLAKKEFWNELLAFTSKDDLLTKAHVEYLEHRIVRLAKDAGRYRLDNGNEPAPAALPRGDRDAMEDFVDAVRVLLTVMGHRVLEPIQVAAAQMGSPIPGTVAPTEEFTMTVGDIVARGVRGDEGFIVRKGSGAVGELKASIGGGYRARRDALVNEGRLVSAANGSLHFSEDVVFSSPSAAACIIAGSARNGRKDWRTSDQRTLGEIEEAEAGSLVV